jgi:hypothetical protein
VQHDQCGNVDFDYNFVAEDSSLHCKKCNKTLKAIGVDYSRMGSYFKCHKCSVLLPTVARSYQCFECGKASEEEELNIVRLPTYTVNREGIVNAIDQSTDLDATAKELEKLGIKAIPNGSITGLSRINHTFALIIYDKRDLPLMVVEIIGSNSEAEQSLLSFIARCNDAKILDKVLIARRSLNPNLKELAEINSVKVVESDNNDAVPAALLDVIKQAIHKSVQVA